MKRSNRLPRIGLQWKCAECGRNGKVYEVFCANCWQPRALLPTPSANPLAFLDDPIFANFVIPFAESTLKQSTTRVPMLIDTLEMALRQFQPVAVQLKDRLPNLAEVSAPQARRAAEQIRMITEVVLPWLETAFFRIQSDLLAGLPDWTARSEIQLTAISLAVQGILDRLDSLVAIMDRYGSDGWQPQTWLPALQALSRQLKG